MTDLDVMRTLIAFLVVATAVVMPFLILLLMERHVRQRRTEFAVMARRSPPIELVPIRASASLALHVATVKGLRAPQQFILFATGTRPVAALSFSLGRLIGIQTSDALWLVSGSLLLDRQVLLYADVASHWTAKLNYDIWLGHHRLELADGRCFRWKRTGTWAWALTDTSNDRIINFVGTSIEACHATVTVKAWALPELALLAALGVYMLERTATFVAVNDG